MPRHALGWLCLLALWLLAACDAVPRGGSEADYRLAGPAPMELSAAAGDFAFAPPEADLPMGMSARDASAPAQVIRESTVTLKVADYTDATRTVRERVAELKGFVARSEQRGEEPQKRSGTLVVRVPQSDYESFLTFIQGLGRVFELSEKAEDVFDRLVDLKQRLANARRLETRILALLEEKSLHIRDIIEAERELAQIRSQIEELEGGLARLEDRVALATFTIHLFVSGSKDMEAKTWYGPLLQDFRDIGFVLAGSLGALLTLLVAGAPWVFLLLLVRRWWRRRSDGLLEANRRALKRQIEGDR